jgi:hypothetical protein
MVARLKNKWHFLFRWNFRSIAILFVILAIQGYGHNLGTIKGWVIGSKTAESLPVANIIIKGTMLGVALI